MAQHGVLLLRRIPAVSVGAVLLVLQGVQVSLGTVAVVQEAGAQLQDGCIGLVGVCVRVRAIRWKQVWWVTVLVPPSLAVSLVGGGGLQTGLVRVNGVYLGPSTPSSSLPQLINGLKSTPRAHGVRIFVRRRATGALRDVGVRWLLGQVALALHRWRPGAGC